jgi:hypothetical protein
MLRPGRQLTVLTIRHEYEFMPKGVVTQLIVALHHLIAD